MKVSLGENNEGMVSGGEKHQGVMERVEEEELAEGTQPIDSTDMNGNYRESKKVAFLENTAMVVVMALILTIALYTIVWVAPTECKTYIELTGQIEGNEEVVM